MASDPATRTDTGTQAVGLLGRLNALETIVVAFISLVALAGILLIAKGYYLKTATASDTDRGFSARSFSGTGLAASAHGAFVSVSASPGN